jgi:actin-related protein
VWEGVPIRSAIKTLPFGGEDLTDYMFQLLQEETEFSYCTLKAYRSIVEDVKTCGWTSINYDVIISDVDYDWWQNRYLYFMPDGGRTPVGPQGLKCGEALFQPSLMGQTSKGVHEALFEAIMQCDKSQHSGLLQNLVFVGGSSNSSGFEDRLRGELLARKVEHEIQLNDHFKFTSVTRLTELEVRKTLLNIITSHIHLAL